MLITVSVHEEKVPIYAIRNNILREKLPKRDPVPYAKCVNKDTTSVKYIHSTG